MRPSQASGLQKTLPLATISELIIAPISAHALTRHQYQRRSPTNAPPAPMVIRYIHTLAMLSDCQAASAPRSINTSMRTRDAFT